MSISKVKASSRPFGVAESLIGVQIDRDAVLRRAVVLTGERETLLTENGRWCLMDCIRLLPRIVGQLTIWLPPGLGALEDEVRYAATTVWGNGSVVLALDDTEVGIADAAAVLNVGSGVRPDLRWTAVNSNGWVARVTSGNRPLPSDVNQANPVAALMAASLGVTEVFKRIYGVPPDVAPLLDLTEFSLYELTTSPKGIGPRLPADVNLPDTVLVGAGAIGNGIALLLSQLRVRCRLHVIDKQAYADENLGTCILLDDVTWLGNSKAERLAKWLRTHSSTEVTGEQALVSEARAGDAVKSMAVDLVLNGLDDVQARHDAQMLWPSVLVDGGINAVGAAVVTHRLDRPGWACMRCGFRLPTRNERDVQSAATGLSHSSLLMDYGRMLTDADVEQAVEAKRPWLREKVKEGKTVCATITEGQSHARLGIELAEGLRPSVPFVATASAALVMAEALKALLYPDAVFTQWFQMESIFLGPDASLAVLSPADPACECTLHRSVIEDLAQRRHVKPNPDGTAG